jgi:TetR/AcrR family transcriptional regulator, acrAB operon repressor
MYVKWEKQKMARRTKEDAVATRNLLLDAAQIVFNEKGVSRTSLAEIATEAGLTRGAIYWHFKNKADLFHAMLERAKLPIENMIDSLDAAPAENPLDHLRNVAVNVLKVIASDSKACQVFDIVAHKCEMVDEMSVARERRVESRSECIQQIEGDLRNAMEKGILPPTLNTHAAAIGLHALIDGLISNWLLNPDTFPLNEFSEQLIGSYINGLHS